jgi:hypothetical protein
VDDLPPGRFLIDGSQSGATPYAALPIAARGILVLDTARMSSPKAGSRLGPYSQSAETALVRNGIEAAVDELARRGLINRDRVGLLGYSRNGMFVHYALTFSKYQFAAAVVDDSIDLSPFCYASLYGFPWQGMAEFEISATSRRGVNVRRAIGAPFQGVGIRLWLQRSYLFHLDRIRTPIRYEQYGADQTPCNWQEFALLRRNHRPVDMIHLPLASHILKQPFARLTSQAGSSDWFDFWLNGHEDSEPAKHEQYTRWEQLCALQRSEKPIRPTFCISSRTH